MTLPCQLEAPLESLRVERLPPLAFIRLPPCVLLRFVLFLFLRLPPVMFFAMPQFAISIHTFEILYAG